ncbi:hypothetical protein BpHYR1_004334 [Brachionus plicatilis]|uniref:Uncharacterized protein n=1 Tax=Brachionus plicatilis TaxID=10195 RepID=A0A3M7SED2_BRAPC|nr:hypothetical protein BpHYR1_004334 [Brachionus plicatilis]
MTSQILLGTAQLNKFSSFFLSQISTPQRRSIDYSFKKITTSSLKNDLDFFLLLFYGKSTFPKLINIEKIKENSQRRLKTLMHSSHLNHYFSINI